MGPFRSQYLHQPADRLIQRNGREAVGMAVGFAVFHARISVAEHEDIPIADDLGSFGKLFQTHLSQPISYLRPVHSRIQNIALLAAGAANQSGNRSCIRIAGDRARPL